MSIIERMTGVLALLLLLTGILGCTSGADTLNMVVDVEQTMALSQENLQRYCFIRSAEICQSPDSALFFHLPKQLQMVPLNRQVYATLRISNDGTESIIIDEYLINIIDDRSVSYEAGFQAPNGYDETHPFSPALVLSPHRDASIDFHVGLDMEARAIKGVIVRYRLPGEMEFSQVVVSYQATNLLQVYDQRRN